MESNIKYYLIPKQDFSVNRRFFIEGKKYPISEDSSDEFIIEGENGTFSFTKHGIDTLVKQWIGIASIEKVK